MMGYRTNPAAVAYEWTDRYEGFEQEYRHELTWTRGTYSVLYGTSVDGRPWVIAPVSNPERLGNFDATEKGFRRLVEAFRSESND
jgi:hypothetical protein